MSRYRYEHDETCPCCQERARELMHEFHAMWQEFCSTNPDANLEEHIVRTMGRLMEEDEALQDMPEGQEKLRQAYEMAIVGKGATLQ